MTALQPPDLDWLTAVSRAATGFFSIDVNHRKMCADMIGKAYDESILEPYSIREFFRYLTVEGVEQVWPRSSQVVRILRSMEVAGMLVEAGSVGTVFGKCFFLQASITRMQLPGILWLTPVLGPQLLLQQVQSAVVHLTGYNHKGDVVGGSGICLDSTSVLTAAHVMEGMKITDEQPLSIGGRGPVADVRIHPVEDVAILHLESPVELPVLGVSARDPEWTEHVTTFGYPPVATSTEAPLIVHRGEIVNPSVPFIGTSACFLYSAVTRPGNSGGPIFGDDGRLVGIVSRETYFQGKPSLPFYVGIPTSVIARALNDLGSGESLQVEDWQKGH